MQSILSELNHEVVATRKLLGKIPAHQLGWKPHKKAMSLGQLALHVATIPGNIAGFTEDGATSVAVLVHHPEAENKDEILGAFDTSILKARNVIEKDAAEWESRQWTLTKGEAEVLVLPMMSLARLLMLNHWYHHRGQLATYLRILDVPVPAIYGPSADETPF